MSATAILNLHSGGHEVSQDQLRIIMAPDATRTWHPVRHAQVLDTARSTLQDAGYHIANQRFAVSHNGARFFGTLDLATDLTQGVTLAVGIRNSHDKTFPIGFIAGSRVFVCSNLSFIADLSVSRKHTRFGSARFSEGIANAVMQLASFRQAEANRIEQLRTMELSDDQAGAFILRSCLEKGIIAQHQLKDVWDEWKEPKYESFRPRTAWSLANAFTTALHELQQKNPADLARRTMRLQSMLALPDTVPALAA